jgi:putative transcriptional regulator
MPKRTNEDARMLQELLDTAADMSTYGVMSKTDMARIRALCEVPPTYSPERIVAIRTTIVKASQAVFATMLNVSVSTVQKWESPSANKRPSGACAKLLQMVEAKGVEVLLV